LWKLMVVQSLCQQGKSGQSHRERQESTITIANFALGSRSQRSSSTRLAC
jgi:hypothetical protein